MKNKIKVRREYDESYVESVTCDICKKTYKGEYWERDNYSALETEIRMTTGTQYVEFSSLTDIEFDVCPTCFSKKIIPLFATKGAVPTVTERQY